MKKMLAICLGLIVLLAACGKNDMKSGVYEGKSNFTLTVPEDGSDTVKLESYYSTSDGEVDDNYTGQVNKKDQLITFTGGEYDDQVKYEVKDDNTIIFKGKPYLKMASSYDNEKMEFKKEDE
ncbi:hypothetical protein [Staphylococcus caeli]|uniref:Lipoprotein n=1 Tax=Staphylococcus caeli TaxID=2201815 RepID=A0A1D4NF23_9STAP|nr:hypothetical protein [Staphylococcus caeli]AWM30223.1 hypothetical protein SCC82B_00083 [Staphylococcus caeli]SCT09312.1 Uncharacterised protein [Staphylococcus caeli]SCT13724.1 Uncharacterised protein [Staphylococcus caeli]